MWAYLSTQLLLSYLIPERLGKCLNITNMLDVWCLSPLHFYKNNFVFISKKKNPSPRFWSFPKRGKYRASQSLHTTSKCLVLSRTVVTTHILNYVVILTCLLYYLTSCYFQSVSHCWPRCDLRWVNSKINSRVYIFMSSYLESMKSSTWREARSLHAPELFCKLFATRWTDFRRAICHIRTPDKCEDMYVMVGREGECGGRLGRVALEKI